MNDVFLRLGLNWGLLLDIEALCQGDRYRLHQREFRLQERR